MTFCNMEALGRSSGKESTAATREHDMPWKTKYVNSSQMRFARSASNEPKPMKSQRKQQRRIMQTSHQSSLEPKSIYVAKTNNRDVSQQESSRNPNIFHPNRHRFSAPMPSLSRQRVPSRAEINHRGPTNKYGRSQSYAKQMRSIESCQSPPRRRKFDAWKSPATIQTERVDRIEESRNPDSAAKMERKVFLNFEDSCNLDPHMKSSKSASKEVFDSDEFDRIECTRESMCETSPSKLGMLLGRRDDQHRDSKKPSSQRNVLWKNNEIVSVMDPAMMQVETEQDNRKTTQSLGNPVEIGYLTPPTRERRPTASIQYQNFHALRIKYTEYIQDVISKAEASEPAIVDTTNNGVEPMVVIRSRPLLDYEIQRQDYSVIDIPLNSSRTLAMYETNMLPCKIGLNVKAHVFQFDAVSSERESFNAFYSRIVQPSINNVMKGGVGGIFVYGSDEFGKTNTLSGIEKQLAHEFFSGDDATCSHSIFVTHLGMDSGTSDLCIDLLSPRHEPVQVLESNGIYSTEGATEICVSSASQLLHAFRTVRQNLVSTPILRQESETSYLLCQIALQRNGSKAPRGVLYLVQCPSGDELCLSREENNTCKLDNPLAQLMELLRENRKTVSAHNDPFCNHYNMMKCSLTKLLGQSLITTRKQPTSVCLIAAVSPSSSNTDSTLSTLLSSRKFMTRRPVPDAGSEESEIATVETKDAVASESTSERKYLAGNESLVLPRQWTQKQLLAWLQRKRLVAENSSFDGEITGKTIMSMTKAQLKDFIYSSDKNNNRANKLFDALRAENDRISRLRVKQKFAKKKTNK